VPQSAVRSRRANAGSNDAQDRIDGRKTNVGHQRSAQGSRDADSGGRRPPSPLPAHECFSARSDDISGTVPRVGESGTTRLGARLVPGTICRDVGGPCVPLRATIGSSSRVDLPCMPIARGVRPDPVAQAASSSWVTRVRTRTRASALSRSHLRSAEVAAARAFARAATARAQPTAAAPSNETSPQFPARERP
jgi:hypothetical protein